jgi:hypothetical protein
MIEDDKIVDDEKDIPYMTKPELQKLLMKCFYGDIDEKEAFKQLEHLIDVSDELDNALEKINRLKKAGDVMYALLNPPSISMRTTEYDNALQGWDDAKIS